MPSSCTSPFTRLSACEGSGSFLLFLGCWFRSHPVGKGGPHACPAYCPVYTADACVLTALSSTHPMLVCFCTHGLHLVHRVLQFVVLTGYFLKPVHAAELQIKVPSAWLTAALTPTPQTLVCV